LTRAHFEARQQEIIMKLTIHHDVSVSEQIYPRVL